MLKSILSTDIFDNLKQDITNPSHAYLFYGEDAMLNIELAKIFIASIFCGKPACGECESCKRIEINKNPDLLIVDKPTLQVADIENLIDNVQLKPMAYKYKVVFIENAEGINEIAQNKLLKTLEEPNSQVIFVLTCTNIEKLLPTIKSRLSKHYISRVDLHIFSDDLKVKGIVIDRFLHCDITLSDAIKYSSNKDSEVLGVLEQTIYGLKSTADIPYVVSKINIKTERKEFLLLMLNATNCAITSQSGVFDKRLIEYMQLNFKLPVLIKMQKMIDLSIKMLDSNVNFNYVLDKLFYNILKEKYLCK